MIRLVESVKNITAIAVSGGSDSMALLSFLRRNNPSITAIYFHHGTEHGQEAFNFVRNYCLENGINFKYDMLKGEKPKNKSWEEFWREARYSYLHSLTEYTIATAHHLNDAAETYLWGCINGSPRFIHYRQPSENGFTNIVRPLLLTPKSELMNWCERHSVPYIQDPSNSDTNYTRNKIRHNIMPGVFEVNSGFLTVVKRLVEEHIDKELKMATFANHSYYD